MGLVVYRSKTIRGHLGVALCSCQRCVTEQLLDRPNVGTALQKVGGARVTQDVRMQQVAQTGLHGMDTYNPPCSLPGEASPAMIEEHRLGVAAPDPAIRDQDHPTTRAEPLPDGGGRQTTEREHVEALWNLFLRTVQAV